MNYEGKMIAFRDAACRKATVAFAMCAMSLCSFTPLSAADGGDDTFPSNATVSVASLSGIDPSADITTTGMPQTDDSKMFCFYNEGAKKFLNIGGLWGTHASISDVPYSIWFENTGKDGVYWLNNNVAGSGTGTYMAVVAKDELYMDKGIANGAVNVNQRATFVFEKADGYSDNNKVYTIKVTRGSAYSGGGTSFYVTTYPDDETKYCNIEKSLYSTTDARYKNQVWKIISKKEYYDLFLANPANMSAAIDASFLMKAPGFRVNDTEMSNWKLSNENADVRFGDATMYCIYAKRGASGDNHFTDINGKKNYNENHQQNYGKYFYCYSKGARGYYLYQDVQVHESGWYLLRCNGFSTSNSMENIKQNGKPLAHLFCVMLGADNTPLTSSSTSSTLNVMSQQDADALETSVNGAGIGKAFFEGNYENQVQLCLDKAANGKDISKDNPVTLRLGIYVDPTPEGGSTTAANELTAVDNFRLLYAGPRRNPELVLDEESVDLRYLTKATDEYKNSVLHLNRKLNDNMWNSLILPVDLTFGQMKRTFGDAVKVAKLAALTNESVRFTTVEPQSDDDVMVKAFEPYIIYPPVVETTSPSYTVEKFYTGEKDDNSQWLGADYSVSTDESNRLTKTIQANHYVITMVSLDRDAMKQHVNEGTWISDTQFSADGEPGTMVCLGTMAKTYDDSGIINGRDDLNGDYFMYKGKLIQVPSGTKPDNGERYSYGLKAFRCWFELSSGGQTSQSKSLQLVIDGVADDATGISDVHTGGDATEYRKTSDGVFNMNGQRVRSVSRADGLPKGIYIIKGKKIVIE